MKTSRDGAGLPVALLVSVLLLIAVAAFGIAAGPDVASRPSASAQAEAEPAAEPAAEPEPAQPGTNLSHLREALGDGFREDPTVLKVVPGSPAATGLPAGFDGVGQIAVQEATATLAEQCPVIDSGSPDTCEVRTLAGGAEVAVQLQQLQELDSDQGFATIAIYFIQPGGDLVQASVTAIGEVTPADDVEALAEQIGDWLAQFEDALTRAATDPRMQR